MEQSRQRIARLSPEDLQRLANSLPKSLPGAEQADGLSAWQLTRPTRVPLSFAQERLWLAEQLGALGSTYNLRIAQRLQGELDADALDRGFTELMRRHETLRTHVEMSEGSPVQMIRPPGTFRMQRMMLAGDERDAAAKAQELLLAEATRPFDLGRNLFRACLLRLAHDDHLLLIVMHHMICDGWSLDVLLGQLRMLYGAYIEHRPPSLPEPELQYADYTLWQRHWLQGKVLERQLSYWRQCLSGMPAALNLPTDRPRPNTPSYQGARHIFRIPGEQIDQLIALGRREGVTLYMMLLAVLQALLGRWTGQMDIVIGTPVAGRTHRKTESLIGFFINTLVLRTDLSGNPPFAELLRRVREAALGAYSHQDLPFEKLVAELRLQRDLSRQALFQVTFALQNFPAPAWDNNGLPQLRVSPWPCELTSVPFDLSWYVFEVEDGWQAGVEYATDLFDAGTIERMAESYCQVLGAVSADPSLRLSELPLLSEKQRHQILVEWNATAVEYPRHRCVHEIFEEQVERTPHAVAVIHEDRTLTYGELNALANQLARYLRDHGMTAGEYVALCMSRSCWMLVAQLAVIKCGGAYVPIDPQQPVQRQLLLINDSGARLVLGQESAPHDGGLAAVRWISCSEIAASVAGLAKTDLKLPVTSASPAYVMYTSGSTGVPKGVVVPHRAVNRLVINSRHVSIGADDCVAHCSNPAFDASTFEIWGALLNGARVLIVPESVILEAKRVAEILAHHGTTVLWLTASLFTQYAESLSEVFVGLRYLLTGGEVVEPRAVERVLRKSSPQCLLNAYGPTESTTFATLQPIGSVDELSRGLPIGAPISNTQIFILDDHLQPVPAGVTGEIYIGGAGVAHGYLNRAGLTAERFIADPFCGEAAGRMYKSGDLGRWRPDGAVEYQGRNDHQVKVRGYRIELGEIEAALSRHPQVTQAVVTLQGDSPTRKQLVAYLAGQAIDVEDVRTHLRYTLPEHMIPAWFVRLDALPLTANGKVDRNALPRLQTAIEPADRYVAPHTPTEELLSHLWAQVLQKDRVGVHDDFFEAGGHSLLAMQLASRIRECFEVEVPARTVFECPTIADLAARIEQVRREGAGVRLPDLTARPAGVLSTPMSFAQERLWFVEQLESLGSAYHMARALRLTGSLNVVALEQSFRALVRRHESLRTHFSGEGGRGVQIVDSTAPFALEQAVLPELTEPHRSTELQRLLQQQFAQPFDLQRGPLFRAFVVKVTERQHVLLFAMHHIVSDGWSLGILESELFTLYRAHLHEQPAPLPDLSVQYADYALWQRQWLQGEVLERQLSYWRGRLSKMPAMLALPTDRPRPDVQTFRGARQALRIDESSCAALRVLARRHKVTLNMVVLAVLKVVLSRWSGQDDIVVGVPVSGRVHRATESVIGLFVNNLVLRTDLSGNPTFPELLERVREVALQAYAHQHLPFERLVAELRPQRSRSRQSLFQVMFSWHTVQPETVQLPDLRVSEFPLEWSATPFDLSWYFLETDRGLAGSVQYATDLFDPETISRWVDSLNNCLKAVVSHANQ